MGADKAREDQLRAFTDRNATTVMGRPSNYLKAIDDSGLKYLTWYSSPHIPHSHPAQYLPLSHLFFNSPGLSAGRKAMLCDSCSSLPG